MWPADRLALALFFAWFFTCLFLLFHTFQAWRVKRLRMLWVCGFPSLEEKPPGSTGWEENGSISGHCPLPTPIQLSSTGGRSAPFPNPCFMGWEGEHKAVFPRSLSHLRKTLSVVRVCGYSRAALVCDAGETRPSSATQRVPWGGSQVRLVLLGKLLILALPHHLHPVSGPSASPQQNLPRMVFLGATR